ncbi:CDP-alcohol phosphatidyltransferase family protein [bacterium]|nr:CDP-alcohol phosphatidyltransferase family protein [bacterium]
MSKVAKSIDRATLIELEWRDLSLYWIARPLGYAYEKLMYIPFLLLGGLLRIIVAPFDKTGSIRKSLTTEGIAREVLTLANIVTAYGFYLWWKLIVLIKLWYVGSPSLPNFFSLTTAWGNFTEGSLVVISFLTVEIFATDFLDGPIARINKRVTALGTLLDHTRDYLAGFSVFSFLLVLTLRIGDIWVYLLSIFVFAGLAAILVHGVAHGYQFTKFEIKYDPLPTSSLYAQAKKIGAIGKKFALEEYQTRLTGRLQFASTAASGMVGLFFYAFEYLWLDILFTALLAITLLITGVYLYELWGDYYEKWHMKMHERSKSMKEKLALRVEKISEKTRREEQTQ